MSSWDILVTVRRREGRKTTFAFTRERGQLFQQTAYCPESTGGQRCSRDQKAEASQPSLASTRQASCVSVYC